MRAGRPSLPRRGPPGLSRPRGQILISRPKMEPGAFPKRSSSVGGGSNAEAALEDAPAARVRWSTRREARGDDRRLIGAIRQGSAEASEALVRRHWPRAHQLAYLIIGDAAAAEDVAQEALLSALGALDRFDRRRRFEPWLNRIVVNRALDWTRSRARRSEVGIDAAGEPPAAPDSPAALSADLASALGSLNAEQRAVVVLRYLLDHSPREIAKVLDVPTGTVKSRLSRALERLARALGEEWR